MNTELRALIDNFRATQDQAVDYLHDLLLIPRPRSGPDWVRTGHLAVREAAKRVEAPDIRLSPHGFGIDVIHPCFRIDFDYGPNGEVDCFDIWRLAVHRYHMNQGKPPVGPYEDIRQWVSDALGAGELQVVPGSHDSFYQDPTLLRSSHASWP